MESSIVMAVGYSPDVERGEGLQLNSAGIMQGPVAILESTKVNRAKLFTRTLKSIIITRLISI